jgi:outer membrane protein OmpA-like peptidoglycan-associated protein
MLRWLLLPLAAWAAVPVQACDAGPQRIYFEPGSALLFEPERAVLAQMLAMAQNRGFIRLSGHSDTSGPAEANLRLSRQRVEAARDVLIGLGVKPDRILTEAYGESRSITALDDGQSAREHRFVQIELLSAAEARKGRVGRAKSSCGG